MKTEQLPNWSEPYLVAAFGGWGDAAGVATTAASFVMQNKEVERVADFDAEELFVFSQTRPLVRLDEQGRRRIQWPQLAIISAKGAPRDAAVLMGPEPQLRWRTFARRVAGFWRQHGAGGPVVMLGAFLAGVSHVGPVMLTGFATTPELRAKLGELGVQRSGYEGPTGIHSALVEALEEEGVSVVSVWAAVPHYLAAVPNPKACAAVLRCVDRLLGLGLDLRELDDAAATFEKQVRVALARSAAVVEAEAEPRPRDEPLPPAEEVVRDVEEFFRKQAK